MKLDECWLIESYTYRTCSRVDREFEYAVSLHNHSCHSIENLAALNQVVKLRFMRPFRGLLQGAFGLNGVSTLNYADIVYNPPYTPEDVLAMESAAVPAFGLKGLHLAITDHDEFAGGLALLSKRPDLASNIAIGEEVSLWFQKHLFHLGVTGLPAADIHATHARIQAAARARQYDELFETLASSGCLVVLNHPMVFWGPGPERIPLNDLLSRYGWAIHAFEVNGMRRREENDRVLELARHWRKPVVGGGDSHLLVPSSIVCVTRASCFADFIGEVKEGRSVPLVRREYFAPLRWKLFLRVLCFMSQYRRIASYRGQPVAEMLESRTVMLDPIGHASSAFLTLVSALGLAR